MSPHLAGPQYISRNFIPASIYFSSSVPASHSMQYSCMKMKKQIQETLSQQVNVLRDFIVELTHILLSLTGDLIHIDGVRHCIFDSLGREHIYPVFFSSLFLGWPPLAMFTKIMASLLPGL